MVLVATEVRTSVRACAELEAAWDHLDRLYTANAGDRRVAGARAAAEWTLGLTRTTPITGLVVAAEGRALQDEVMSAGMAAHGVLPTDREFGRGAVAWLEWFTGMFPLPRWLREG